MDLANNSDSPVVLGNQSEFDVAAVVGDKRPLDNGQTGELGARSAKKANTGDGGLRRVAEIVLVLSAMAGMRGGRNPTETELNLMTEARAKLVEICQDLSPEDLVVKDAIGALIEDLGLNWKIKDQRLGYRGSRLSIKDRFSLAKMQMEESKKYNTTPAPTYTSQTSQPSFGVTSETRGPSHSIRMYQSDKPSNPSLTSGGLPGSAVGHISAANSTSVMPQYPNTDVRASPVSTGIANSHLATGPGIDNKTQFKFGVGSNGTTYAPQVQANQPLASAPSWSLHSHSISSINSTPESKVNYSAGKSDRVADLGSLRTAPQASNQVSRPIIAQSTSTTLPSVHQPVQGVKYVQTSPVFNNHNEIAKIVQKLLHPELPQHPTWIPPSREYMCKPVSCQMCHVMMNEVESVVVCDACEKGFHLKCLETINQKGIPRGGEWHCIRCTTLSNGKPLPPKYGRVMRSATQVKGASNSPGAQSSIEKKSESVDQKVGQDMVTAKESSAVQDPSALGAVISKNAKPESELEVLNARDMEANSMTPALKGMDQGSSAASAPDNSINALHAISDSASLGLSSESSTQPPQVSESHSKEEKPVSESNLQPPISAGIINDNMENSRPSCNLEDTGKTELSNACEFPLKTNQDTTMGKNSENKEEHSENTKPPCNLEFTGKTELSNACEIPLTTNQDTTMGKNSENKEEHSDLATSIDVRPELVINDNLENSKPSNNLEDVGQTELSNACEVPLETNQNNVMGEGSENKEELNDLATSSDVRRSELDVTDANAVGSSEGNELATSSDVRQSDLDVTDANVVGSSEANELATSSDVRQSDLDVTDANVVGSSEANEQATNHTSMSSDGSHNVQWIGNALKVVDGKTYYGSCFINGIMYKVHDHVLFCSGNEKFMPSKLQAMWEDIESGSKWVAATQCYFPGDLPEAVVHPCAPESNEVYESNHENTMMASLIQGPCEVLPPTKFQENRERQNQLGVEGDKAYQSVFLCKWFYDKSKGSFQPVTN